jgi:hypothetical protein
MPESARNFNGEPPMSRLLPSVLVLAVFFVVCADPAASQDQKRKPISGKVVDISKNADGKVESFIVEVRKNFNKSILVDGDTKYEYMNKPAKVEVIVVGAAIGATYNKAGSDYASVVKISKLPK